MQLAFHCLNVVVWSSSTLLKTVGCSLHCVCRVRCCETFHLSSYDPSSTLGTVGTLLNLICVVVGVNIVSFFIVKVCLFPPNTMGFLPFLLLRLIVSQQHVGVRQ